MLNYSMQLSELVEFSEERCQREKPLLYAGIYLGRDINEKKDALLTRKKRPMRFFAGIIDVTYKLSGKDELPDYFEISFHPPWIHFDVAKGTVSWETCEFIDVVRTGDIVEFDRGAYERKVR